MQRQVTSFIASVFALGLPLLVQTQSLADTSSLYERINFTGSCAVNGAPAIVSVYGFKYTSPSTSKPVYFGTMTVRSSDWKWIYTARLHDETDATDATDARGGVQRQMTGYLFPSAASPSATTASQPAPTLEIDFWSGVSKPAAFTISQGSAVLVQSDRVP